MTKAVVRPIVRSVVRSIVRGAVGGEPGEFITNGAFAGDGSPWSILNDGWTIAGGVATNADTGEESALVQTLVAPVVPEAEYVLSIDIVDNSVSSRLHVVLFGAENQELYVEIPAGPVLEVPFQAGFANTQIRLYTSLDPGIVIDNVSLEPA